MSIEATPELRQAIGQYIADNLIVKTNQKGTGEYLTLESHALNVENCGGYSFRLNFATMGMKPADVAAKNRVERIKDTFGHLSADEKAALLDELTR